MRSHAAFLSTRAMRVLTAVLLPSLTILGTVGTAATGCHVRGRMGVPITVHATPSRTPPPPRPTYYAAPIPSPVPYASPPAAPFASCIDPGERDLPDLFDHPTPIQPNSTTVACTHRSDADLFAIAVPPGPAGHLVRYSVRGQVEMAPTLEIYNANRKRLDRGSTGKRQELIGWVYVAGGTHVLARVGQVHGVSEAYTLAVQTTPLPDDTEPNDVAEQATALAPGKTLSGFMGNPANNEGALSDWYRVDVTRDGELAIDVDMSQGIAANALLYDAFSRRMIRQQSASRGERFLLKFPVRRGTYHLLLKSVHRVEEAGSGEPPSSLTRPYTISVAP